MIQVQSCEEDNETIKSTPITSHGFVGVGSGISLP